MKAAQLQFQKKILVAGICIIYIIIFGPVLLTDFVPNSDDQWYVLDNPQLKVFNLRDVFSHPYNGQYSPLNTFFIFLIKHAAGFNPFYFHLYSLLLHTCNAILLFIIIKKVTDHNKISNYISFFSSLLFLFHPLQIETVAWVSASKWLLVTFFMLLSILFYLQFRIRAMNFCLLYSFLFFVLAILSKEIGVVLPLLILIIEIYFFRKSYLVLKNLIPFLLLALLFGVFTLYIPVFRSDLQELRIKARFTLLDDIFLSIRCIGDYFFYLLIPIRRPLRLGLITGNENIFQPIIAVTLFISITGILLYLKNKVLIGCFLIFLVNIFLSLPLIPTSRATLIADRYMYVAGIGIWIGVAIFFFLNRRKLMVNILFGIYLLYIIMVALAESYKWYITLPQATNALY